MGLGYMMDHFLYCSPPAAKKQLVPNSHNHGYVTVGVSDQDTRYTFFSGPVSPRISTKDRYRVGGRGAYKTRSLRHIVNSESAGDL